MRYITFTLLLIVVGSYVSNAQLSIVPQLGFENTRTTIRYNDLSSFAPLAGGQMSPQLALRMDYKFKQQHGPFLGIASSRSLVNYQFTDPENGMNKFKATPGDMQLRFEGGYQFSSKPFYFKKSASTTKTAVSPVTTPKYKSYGSYQSGRGHCGKSYNKAAANARSIAAAAAQAKKEQDKGWYMAIQPLVGAALIPSVKQDIIAKAAGNQADIVYNAGNWSSALITGAGFEFGKNVEKKFVLTVQYLKGIGNLNEAQVTSMAGAKETITRLNSDVSGWSVKAGIPISLTKKKAVVKQVIIEQPRQTEKKCGEYKTKCGRLI